MVSVGLLSGDVFEVDGELYEVQDALTGADPWVVLYDATGRQIIVRPDAVAYIAAEASGESS